MREIIVSQEGAAIFHFAEAYRKPPRIPVLEYDSILDFLRIAPFFMFTYEQVFTADHGMDPIGFHGGTDSGVRTVPFYVMAPDLKVTGRQPDVLDQTTLAHFLCLRLGVPPAATMHPFPEKIYNVWF